MILCAIGMTETIVIIAAVILIFGGKKIPELMKGVGKGVRSFKEGLAEPSDDGPLSKEKGEKSTTQMDSDTSRK